MSTSFQFGERTRQARRAGRRRLLNAATACVETLETRVLMTAVPLNYAVPDALDHTLTLSLQGSNVVLVDNGVSVAQSDMGSVSNVSITGGSGQDTLQLDFSGGVPIPSGGLSFTGGGASNRLVLENANVFNDIYNTTDATSGTISINGGNITYANIGGITDSTTAFLFSFSDTAAADQINLVDGPMVGGAQSFELNSGSGMFVPTDVTNKQTISMYLNSGNDVVNVNLPVAAARLSQFDLDTANAQATVNLLATPGAVTTSINSSSVSSNGPDTFNVGNAGSVQGILGPLSLADDASYMDVTIDDSANPVGTTVQMDRSSITGLAPATISYSAMDMGTFTVNAGSGGNTINVLETVPGSPTFLNTGVGSDSVTVDAVLGGSSLNLNGQGGHDVVHVNESVLSTGYASLLGPLNVSNPSGSTALSVDTTAETTAQNVVVTAGGVQVTTTTPMGFTTTSHVNYSLGAGTVSVTTGTGDDTFTVNGTSLPTTLTGGAGANAYTVNMGALAGAVSLVESGSGQAALVGTANPDTLSIGPAMTSLGGAVVSYSGFAQVSVQGGAGSDTFNVTPSATTTFWLDGGDPAPPAAPGDKFNLNLAGATNPTVSSTSTASGFQGTYTFDNRQPVNFVNIETLPGSSSADLALTFTGPATVSENGTITYSFTVTNNGPSDATNVVLTDPVPAGATFSSATLGQGTFSVSSGTLMLNLGTVVNGASVAGTISFVVADDGATVADSLTAGSDVDDPQMGNNSGVVSTGVIDAPLALTGGFVLNGSENLATASQTVTTFTDPAGAEALADYSAVINWGDQSSSAGVITYDPATGLFTVSGSHTYAEDGTYAPTVTVHHDSAADVTVSDTATIGDPAVVVSPAANWTLAEFASATVTVATFTDPAGAEALTDYSAGVSWSDGVSSPGTISFNSATGVFTVTTQRTFADDGAYTTTVSVSHDSVASPSVQMGVTATDPAVSVAGTTLSAIEGSMFLNAPVATFADPAGAERLSNYSAVVSWGDGSSGPGTISFNSATGLFTVAGSHVYATAGSYSASVVVHHGTAPDASATDGVTVSDPSVQAIGGFSFPATANASSGTRTLATFTDPGGAESLGHYAASIAWGDGTTSPGTVAFNAATKVFTVLGAHTYTKAATDAVTLTVSHDSSPSVNVTDTFTVSAVPDPPFITAMAVTSPINEGATAHLTASIGEPAGGGTMTLVVNWGTGQGTSTYTFPEGTTHFDVTHLYADNPSAPASSFAVGATLSNSQGKITAGTSVVVNNVAPKAAPVSGPSAGVRGQTLAFTDAFTDSGVLDTHKAVINWGDGTKSTGLVTESKGSGSVYANHVFTSSGVYSVTVTVTDKDGGSTSVSKMVNVTAILMEQDPTFGGTMLVIGGTTGADTIDVKSKKGGQTLKVTINGTTANVPATAGRIVVYSQDGNDMVRIARDVVTPAFLFAGSGNDTLIGGGGPTVLVGGPGNDVLAGGEGRNLLFGEGGSSILLGGGQDDILVAGATAYDHNDAALGAIFNEWTLPTASYASRVNHLMHGGGLNGSYVLNNSTVSKHNGGSILVGNAGMDWFLFSNGDMILDRAVGEIATKI